MKKRTSDKRGTAGFSLLEVSIAITLLGTVLGSVALFQHRSQEAVSEMLVRARAEGEARAVLDQVVQELTGVGRQQLTPNPSGNAGAETITYQKPIAVSNAGVVTWSPNSRLALAMDDGEADNGVDDDGDGFIDERRLVLTRNVGTAAQQFVTLLHGLPELVPGEAATIGDDNGNGVSDERGFNVQLVGDLLTVRLCVQRRSQAGNIVTVFAQTAVVVNN
ncbi:MAG: prepilin-type N-terminal cleavage/methylation domain-containing protein [Planctomycetes bacterium]|nr:prepilin-type N-terminal cleavage/methylation domain-containing protein [Planctomycetota bacterium]